MKTQRTLLSMAAAMFVLMLGADAPDAEETSSKLSPKVLEEIAQVDIVSASITIRLGGPRHVTETYAKDSKATFRK